MARFIWGQRQKSLCYQWKNWGKIWEFETGGQVQSSPAIGEDGTIYFGSKDGKLYAINGKTGIKLWEFETANPLISSPSIGSYGTVYVGSSDKKSMPSMARLGNYGN